MNSDNVHVAMKSHSNANPESDRNKFTKLCSELECGLANSYSALDEVLGLKNVLLEQDLPSAVKVKITLAVGRLHRSMSDLSVPTGEITRLVQLYAVPWENKSKALKKLHQDYESKQHQLEIALRRLEMIGVQTMRMEKERRIMNWEKLFAKVVGGKSHGQRWRFLIHQFKQKLKNGEDLANVYSVLSDDEEEENDRDEEQSGKKSNVQFAQELREKMQKFDRFPLSTITHQTPMNNQQESKAQRNSFIEEESEASLPIGISDDNHSTTSNELDSYSVASTQTRKKVRFDDHEGVSRSSDAGVEESQPTDNDLKREKKILNIGILPVEKIDKDTWTHEPDYETLFHIRLFKPKCKTLSSSWCTVVFDNEIRKGQVFKDKSKQQAGPVEQKPDKQKIELEEKPTKNTEPTEEPGHKESEKIKSFNENTNNNKEGTDFQEFSFKLSSEFMSRNTEDIMLKFSVHPANKKTMIAMTNVKLSDIQIIDEEKIKASARNNDKLEPNILPIKATVNNSELIFNRTCGELQLICYYSKVILPKFITRGTETLSIEELTNRIIELRKREYLKRLKSSGTSMAEKPIYTEDQMRSAKEDLKQELNSLKGEYEERLTLMISQLNKENVESLREFVNAATSPLFMWSESNMPNGEEDPFKGAQMQPVKPMRGKSPKKSTKKTDKKQQIWGENLPEDFYERMEMFKEESFKHHQKLKQKITEEVGKEIEKKLASNNRLDTSSTNGKISDEVCLPALYMPTKTRNLYTPKARSYFHAFGTYNERLTQPPSILQLPRLKNDNSDIIGIYESVMKEKMDKLSGRENDTDFGRFSPGASSSIELSGMEKEPDEDLP